MLFATSIRDKLRLSRTLLDTPTIFIDHVTAEEPLALIHHHCDPVADLEIAVAEASLSTVFTILAEWQVTRQMLDHRGKIRPGFTTSANLMALQCNRSDILSLLLSTSSTKVMHVKEAISAGYVAHFQALLWNGCHNNAPVEHDGPSALR